MGVSGVEFSLRVPVTPAFVDRPENDEDGCEQPNYEECEAEPNEHTADGRRTERYWWNENTNDVQGDADPEQFIPEQ